MTPECRHILPSGLKCRAAAVRSQPFCRHHGSRPVAPAFSGFSRARRWRSLGRNLAHLDKADIPAQIYDILDSLLDDCISDLTAGRFLRALLCRLGSVPFTFPFSPDAQPQPPFASTIAHPSAPNSPAPHSPAPRIPAAASAIHAAEPAVDPAADPEVDFGRFAAHAFDPVAFEKMLDAFQKRFVPGLQP